MELLDAMRSQHACRYYRPDPVPPAVFYRAVEAARFAPQGGNRQPVRFLVVTDPAKRAQLAEWYLVPWKAYVAAARSGGQAMEAASGDEKATQVQSRNPEKVLADADQFADHFADHPAIVVALANLADTHPTDTDLGRLSIVGGASVYPAVQNLCLALRDQGVATTLTTLLCAYEPQVKQLLGIPAELSTAAFVVAGYPARPFPTTLTRRPVEEIAFLETLDRPLTASGSV
jgi:nitroreductase